MAELKIEIYITISKSHKNFYLNNSMNIFYTYKMRDKGAK